MNSKELNNEFEILFEDLATAGSKGLDGYEKSVCFTYAQDSIVKSLARQKDLVDIIELVKFNEDTVSSSSVYRNGISYKAVPKALMTLDHFLRSTNEDITAILTPQAIIDSMLSSAYKYPPKNLAYVVVGENIDEPGFIVFPPLFFTPEAFVTRFVTEPTPVILEILTGGLTIRGESSITLPMLKDSYQSELVNAAVQFAIKLYIGQPEKEAGNDGSRNKQ